MLLLLLWALPHQPDEQAHSHQHNVVVGGIAACLWTAYLIIGSEC